MRKLWLVAATLFIAACGAAAVATAPAPVRYRLSDAQVAAIKNAKVVTAWVDGTLWISADGGKPLDESHPCPPFPPETCP